jgi:hypothetical protein
MEIETKTMTNANEIDARTAYSDHVAADAALHGLERAFDSLGSPLPEPLAHAERRALEAAAAPLMAVLTARRDAAYVRLDSFRAVLGAAAYTAFLNAMDRE